MKIKAVGDRAVLAELGDSINESVNRMVMELKKTVLSSQMEGIL